MRKNSLQYPKTSIATEDDPSTRFIYTTSQGLNHNTNSEEKKRNTHYQKDIQTLNSDLIMYLMFYMHIIIWTFVSKI